MATDYTDYDDYQDDWDEYLDPEFYDEDGNLLPECGMGSDGQCGMAGSEECDECPNMMALIMRSERRKKRMDGGKSGGR